MSQFKTSNTIVDLYSVDPIASYPIYNAEQISSIYITTQTGINNNSTIIYDATSNNWIYSGATVLGVTGPTGPTGPQGLMGPTGANGTGSGENVATGYLGALQYNNSATLGGASMIYDFSNYRLGIGSNSTPINSLDVNGNMCVGTGYAGIYNAPTNGLLVQGYMGIGTDTPRGECHVNASSITSTGYGIVNIETQADGVGQFGFGISMGYDDAKNEHWIYSRHDGGGVVPDTAKNIQINNVLTITASGIKINNGDELNYYEEYTGTITFTGPFNAFNADCSFVRFGKLVAFSYGGIYTGGNSVSSSIVSFNLPGRFTPFALHSYAVPIYSDGLEQFEPGFMHISSGGSIIVNFNCSGASFPATTNIVGVCTGCVYYLTDIQ